MTTFTHSSAQTSLFEIPANTLKAGVPFKFEVRGEVPLIPTGRLIREETFDEAAEAVQRADAHADRQWKDIALSKVRYLCETMPKFTADDFWEEMSKTMAVTHENRAYGSTIRQAVKNGWCIKTQTFVKSTRKHCHAMDIPIYESLLFHTQ